MAATYTLISSVTVGSGGASSIAFSSIPSTYTDLIILSSLRTNISTENFDGIRMTFNNDSTSRTDKRIYGTGSGVGNGQPTVLFASMASTALNTSNTFGNGYCYIPNYAGSTNKSTSTDGASENNATVGLLDFNAGLWSNTSAITSIQLTSENAANFVQYSTAYLYGVSNA